MARPCHRNCEEGRGIRYDLRLPPVDGTVNQVVNGMNGRRSAWCFERRQAIFAAATMPADPAAIRQIIEGETRWVDLPP